MGIPSELSLCVDGGGSSCRAAIAKNGKVIGYHEEAVSCNFVAVGLSNVVRNVERTVQVALKQAGLASPTWHSAVIGLAGLEGADESDLAALHNALASALPATSLRICRDGDLLSYTLLEHKNAKAAVCLICGTGTALSLAIHNKEGQPERRSSAGGYGSSLGDDGSGYAIGRLAIRSTLKALDRLPHDQRSINQMSAFHSKILQHFDSAQDQSALISKVLQGSSSSRIASACLLVFRYANSDPAAAQILQTAATEVAEQVDDLLQSYQNVEAKDMVLIAGGSVIGQTVYRELLLKALQLKGIAFIDVIHVDNVSKRVAEVLSKVSP